jgi:hypothetical protein
MRIPRRFAALTLGLAVLVGVFVGPGAAEANPYWRVGVGVAPGKASCKVTWTRDYWDGPVATYKIWVVPQQVAPNAGNTYRKITVTPQNPGLTKTITVGGLRSGRGYVFWLEALYPSYFRSGQVSVQQGTSRVCKPT